MSGTMKSLQLMMISIVFRPDITEMVDWAFKKHTITYLPRHGTSLKTDPSCGQVARTTLHFVTVLLFSQHRNQKGSSIRFNLVTVTRGCLLFIMIANGPKTAFRLRS